MVRVVLKVACTPGCEQCRMQLVSAFIHDFAAGKISKEEMAEATEALSKTMSADELEKVVQEAQTKKREAVAAAQGKSVEALEAEEQHGLRTAARSNKRNSTTVAPPRPLPLPS